MKIDGLAVQAFQGNGFQSLCADLNMDYPLSCFVPNMDEGWARRLVRVEWVIATGDQDSLVEETRRFSQILRSKGIPVHCEVWPGVFGHDWPFWKEHLRRFLP